MRETLCARARTCIKTQDIVEINFFAVMYALDVRPDVRDKYKYSEKSSVV